MTGLREAKAALRKETLGRRDAVTRAERSSFSQTIVGEVLDLPAYQRAGTVLAYASFGTELETDRFLRRVLGDGKALLLPRVDRGKRRLVLFEIEDPESDLQPGVWGIREPRDGLGAPAEPDAVDFVLVPGVAFDRRGGRLGYGGGFYDRLISEDLGSDAALISGAFEFQIVEEVPKDQHDASVDLVLTEAGRYPA